MDIDLSAFHFLRPWWLLAVPLAALLWWARRGERGAPGRDLRIAPALLPYLVLRTPGSRGPRPIDALALFLALGGVAAAGPAWQRDEPAYLDNVAPLIVALDLSASMDGADVPPTRLEAARRVLRDLAARRAAARTGLIAYAGSSHLVLPPTDDAALLDLFAQALATGLIERPGRDADGAIALAAQALAAERAGGTLLILTDGADRARMDAVRRQAQAARDMQVLVMAVGVNGIDTQALQELARRRGVGQPDGRAGRPGLDRAACAGAFPGGAGCAVRAGALEGRGILAVLAIGLAGPAGGAPRLERGLERRRAGRGHGRHAAAGARRCAGRCLPDRRSAGPPGLRARTLRRSGAAFP